MSLEQMKAASTASNVLGGCYWGCIATVILISVPLMGIGLMSAGFRNGNELQIRNGAGILVFSFFLFWGLKRVWKKFSS